MGNIFFEISIVHVFLLQPFNASFQLYIITGTCRWGSLPPAAVDPGLCLLCWSQLALGHRAASRRILTVATLSHLWKLLFPDSYYSLTVELSWQLLYPHSYNYLIVTSPWQLLLTVSFYPLTFVISWQLLIADNYFWQFLLLDICFLLTAFYFQPVVTFWQLLQIKFFSH